MISNAIAIPDNTEAPFTGIKKTPALSRLQKYDFWEIAPGTSIKEVWDITETWDILDGGDYFVSMSGLLPNIDNIGMKDGDRFINFAKPVVFRSNTLTINIEDTPRIQGLQNMERKTRHEKEKQDACNSDQRDVLKKVYSNCHKLAKEAAEAARTGPADRVIEHFQVADNFTRAAVSSVFDLVSMECGEAGRTVRNHCSKEDTLCDAKTEIYINPDSGDITFCEAFWAHPPMPKDCERRMITPNGDSWVTPKFGIPWWDITWEGNSNVFQMTMLIHVLTQMSSNARAQGFAYTYKTMKHLSYMDNLYNAETYALFAGAVKLNCPVK